MRLHRSTLSIGTFIALAAIVACSCSVLQQPTSSQLLSEYPTTPPPALALEPIEFPSFHERTLANGARLFVVPNREQPVVSITLAIRAGSASESPEKAGLAVFTAELLTKGTSNRSARDIAETVGLAGGQLVAAAGDDWTTLQTTILSDHLDGVLALLADAVTNPAFAASELGNLRAQKLTSLQSAASQPDALAERRFRQALYGKHPYGQAMTRESIRSIAREDIVRFYERFYRASGALVVVSGDVEPTDIARRLESRLAGWQPGAIFPEPLAPPPAPLEKRRLVVVHKPGSVQAVFRLGHLLPAAQAPDWPKIQVAQFILGGAGGRLMQVLREQKGYAYSAYATAQQRNLGGSMIVSTEVRTAVADSALAEMLRVLAEFVASRYRKPTLPARRAP